MVLGNMKAILRTASGEGGQMVEVKSITRHQRRARRRHLLAAAREAPRAALQAGLDYRVSGETGALVVHTHSLSWHRAKSPNLTVPPPGRGWDRSGPARVVGGHEAEAPNLATRQQRVNREAETDISR